MRGEQHGRAKLTAAQVHRLRELAKDPTTVRVPDSRGRIYWRKQWDGTTLAHRYDISPEQARAIVRGRYWRR
jgi:hypothetical protein